MKIRHHLNIIVPLKSGVFLKGFLLLHGVLICYLPIEIEFLPALSISLTIQYILLKASGIKIGQYRKLFFKPHKVYE